MILKKWHLLNFGLSLCFLTACGGSDNDDNDIEQIDRSYTMELSKTYSDDIDFEDDIRTTLTSTNITSASQVSVDVTFDEDSVLSRDVDGTARLESYARLVFVDLNDDSIFTAGVGLRVEGDGIYGAIFLQKCFDLDSNCEGIFSDTDEPLDIDLGDTVNISMDWSEAEQKFIANIGAETMLEVYLADLQADEDIIAEGGFDFSQHTFSSIQLDGTVRNIELPGESGELITDFNNVSYDGNVYDTFDTISLDTDRWIESTFEF